MSPTAPVRRRPAFSVLAVALALASTYHYARERSLRIPADRYAERFAFEVPPSDSSETISAEDTMRLEPAGDLAAAVVVDMLVRQLDAGGERQEGALARASGDRPPPDREERLRAARDLMLDAIVVRPGWPHHAFLVGQLAFVSERAERRSGSPARTELWTVPLVRAAAAAPGADQLWTALGRAYLEAWADLPEASRADAPRVIGRAFQDPDFVAASLPSAMNTLGQQEALRLLPEMSRPLEAALGRLAGGPDLASAAAVLARLETIERKSRESDLRTIAALTQHGEDADAAAACAAWVREHSVSEFDDRRGHAELSRLLELWPEDPRGPWGVDPRAEVLGFLLDGRTAGVDAGAIRRAADSLLGVPLPVQARIGLLSGEIGTPPPRVEWPPEETLDWTTFLVELATVHVKAGRVREAQEALAAVPPEVRDSCDVLLARRQIARSTGDRGELAAINDSLSLLSRGAPPQDGPKETTLTLCVDPEKHRGGVIAVNLELRRPAIVSYGWDGGRSGQVRVAEGRSRLTIPLGDRVGRHSLSLRTVVGNASEPRASVEMGG